MKYKLLLSVSLLLISLTAQAEWFLRGSHNGWTATQMDSASTQNTMVLNNVVFEKAGSIKFDRFGDWFENYGLSGIYGTNIPVGAGSWRIAFYTDTKNWKITPAATAYHLRGTMNGWTEGTLMNKVGSSNIYEYCHDSDGSSSLQFKVDPNGGWGADEVPASNYVVMAPGWVKITYDADTTKITTQKNLTLHCGKAWDALDAEVAAIYQAEFCDSAARSTVWINSVNELDAFLSIIRRSLLTFPTPDFASHKLLVLHSGSKPSTGYGLKLANSAFDNNTNTWNMVIEDLVPNNAQLTVVTKPCLILQMPTIPNANVQIKDINGDDFI